MACCITFIRSACSSPPCLSCTLQHESGHRNTETKVKRPPLEQGFSIVFHFNLPLTDWLIEIYQCRDSTETAEEMLPGLVSGFLCLHAKDTVFKGR